MINIIEELGQVTAPGQNTSLGMYIIDRGQGREVIHTCYIEKVWEERIEQGLIKPCPVPTEMENEEVPYHPEIWAKK